MIQERNGSDAEWRRQFRNPDSPVLSEERHEAHAEEQRQYRNPDNPVLSQERHEADAARDRARNLPGQLERAEETPEQAQERMQRAFDDRATTRNANKKACNIAAFLKASSWSKNTTLSLPKLK